MKEEVLKVLEMLQQGQVTAEQAAQLIEALEVPAKAETDAAATPDTAASGAKPKRRMRITVTSPKGDNVNIKIPTRLVTAGVKISKYFTKKNGDQDSGMKDLDWDDLNVAIRQMIEDNEEGEIMDIVSEKGDNIKIWLE